MVFKANASVPDDGSVRAKLPTYEYNTISIISCHNSYLHIEGSKIRKLRLDTMRKDVMRLRSAIISV